jgi:hypothetical protein
MERGAVKKGILRVLTEAGGQKPLVEREVEGFYWHQPTTSSHFNIIEDCNGEGGLCTSYTTQPIVSLIDYGQVVEFETEDGASYGLIRLGDV